MFRLDDRIGTDSFPEPKMLSKLYLLDKPMSLKPKPGAPVKSAPPKPASWPVHHERHRVAWYPARHRLIGMVRTSPESHILPPAMIRKTSWRE